MLCFILILHEYEFPRGFSSGTATRMRQTRLPPEATRPATSSASRHPLPSLAAVMGAPERRNMPLLHPQRLNGGLWSKYMVASSGLGLHLVLASTNKTFRIDDCIRKDVVATYQSNFWQKYYWDPQHHSETVEAGGVAPALTALVLKTHSSKDNTCIDKRAEGYVKAAEALALERSQSATATGENASAPSTQQLNAAYIETATNTKGRVYGLGSLQYVDADPKESPAASLRRNVGVDGRLTTVEGVVTWLKDDVSGLKDDVSGLKQSINLLLKMNGVDPITRQPIPRESGASAPSPHSDSSQELNQHTPTH
ncbi:hypothetical protein F2Q69_00010130 [Brassica cretica]|uniref:Uncharacterized protein n=1 Tax=Brassica cretica TaxID=69181 RepID=A0A8S9PBP9_BRACR|nr:hypothetical protein F2Q69_00010130 [Brassica cretica]